MNITILDIHMAHNRNRNRMARDWEVSVHLDVCSSMTANGEEAGDQRSCTMRKYANLEHMPLS
jgi:hypothetical protein